MVDRFSNEFTSFLSLPRPASAEGSRRFMRWYSGTDRAPSAIQSSFSLRSETRRIK